MVVLELHVQMIDEQCTQFTQNFDHNKPCLWIRCSVLCVHLQVRTCTLQVHTFAKISMHSILTGIT